MGDLRFDLCPADLVLRAGVIRWRPITSEAVKVDTETIPMQFPQFPESSPSVHQGRRHMHACIFIYIYT